MADALSIEEMAALIADPNSNPPYEDVRALEEKLEPWVNFIVVIDGSEIGDFFRGVYNSVGLMTSAGDYGLALFTLTYLKLYILSQKDTDWWREAVEMEDNERQTMVDSYKPEHIPEHLKRSLADREKELPDLT